MIEIAGVLIRKGRAYLPVNAKIQGDGYLEMEPVFEAELTEDALIAALEKIIAAGHPLIPPPSKEEMKRRKDPVLIATGAKSWNQLAKDSFSYTIAWHDGNIKLFLHALDEKGRFASGLGRYTTFQEGTPLSTIVKAILDDVAEVSPSK